MLDNPIFLPYAQISKHITCERVSAALGSGHYFPEVTIQSWCTQLQEILGVVDLEIPDGQMLQYVPITEIKTPDEGSIRRMPITQNRTLQQVLCSLPRTPRADIVFGDDATRQLVRVRRLQICDIGPYAQVYRDCGVVSGYLGVGTTIFPNRNIAVEEPVVVVVREPLRQALRQYRDKKGWLYPALEAHIREGNFTMRGKCGKPAGIIHQ